MECRLNILNCRRQMFNMEVVMDKTKGLKESGGLLVKDIYH